jgi:N-acetylglucosaminyl-diphospho-decaprenol L-rhamnosyltransferase
MHDLAILIVNWNVRDLLSACLASVYADLARSGLQARVWVVDNASQDDSPKMVRAHFPEAHLIVSKKNLGFAGGNNLALRRIDTLYPPRYVLLLNPDTEVRPGALRALVHFLEDNLQVGVAGARLFFGDGGFQHSAFGFPGLWQILFDLYPLPSRLYESRLNGRYPREWYERGVPFPVDHPLGAAMIVRWEVIHQVGLLDEGFHMYCEEIDWCMRIKTRSWEIYCVPAAEVVHHEGRSTRQIREESFVNLWRSRRRLYDKHYGPLKGWLARLLVRTGMRRKTWVARRAAHHGDLDVAEAAAQIRTFTAALAQFQ